MKNKDKHPTPDKRDPQEQKFPGYPPYPEGEDIYNKFEKEDEVDPDDTSKQKAPNDKNDTPNEKDFPEIVNGDDLDIPGAELDDEQEALGSEDEENNYYSLGGDNHTDLDEREDNEGA